MRTTDRTTRSVNSDIKPETGPAWSVNRPPIGALSPREPAFRTLGQATHTREACTRAAASRSCRRAHVHRDAQAPRRRGGGRRAGRLGVAPGTATTDEPTDVAAVAGRWALTLGDAVGADAATDIVTAALEWLAARYHVGLALAATDAPGAAADVFALGRTLGAAEEHARHLREAWALPVLVAWSDETAEA